MEDVKHRFGMAVGSDDGISRVCRHGDLIFQPVNPVCAGEVAGFLPHQDFERILFLLDEL